MLKFLSSMICTSRIHPFSLGNYLRTSLIIGNLMVGWLVGKIQEKEQYCKVNIEYVSFLLFDHASSHFISGRPH